jgi:hypothetical protein
VRYGAPRMGRPRRHKTVVKSQVVENKPGVVSRFENSLSIASGAGEKSWGPSQNLPSTAIYCHFGAAKPLSPFQLFHSLLAPRGHAGQPGPRAENRERGREEPRWYKIPSLTAPKRAAP